MKKIIINGRFLTQRITGVQRYAREICTELDKIVNPSEIIMAVPPEANDIPDYQNIEVVKVGNLHNRLWEHVSFPRYVKRQQAISLNLCNVAPLISPGMVVIHDVKIKIRPQDFSWKFRLWYELLLKNETKRAVKIITVSKFSKNEIEKYYGVSGDRITVIQSAWQHYERIGYDENALKKYGLEKESYFFSMSSLEPNKNFKWIAEEAKRNPQEIVAVAGSLNKSVFANGLGFTCPENMKLLGYVSDEEAKELMRNCKAFLFPTFYEGFGLPPLEAISAGCKCAVVSDTEVMHEVFGDSVNYVNPKRYDVDLSSFHEIWESEKVLNRYSWEKSARKFKGLWDNQNQEAEE